MSAIFVTATGTDIGKSFVTAGLVREIRAAGGQASALKPVISGFDMRAAAASDTGVLLEAMGERVTAEAVARLSPWRFAEPLSPDMAAAREKRSIDFAQLVAFCRDAVARARDPLFIEGVGGVMVPLDATRTVLDWIAALEIPALLVAGSYLGTLSHTLTALDALRRRSIPLAALVVNESAQSPVPIEETSATLARFAAGVPIIPLPRGARGEAFARLAETVMK